MTPDDKNESQIKIEIAIAKNSFQLINRLFTPRKISMELRHQSLVSYVFSIVFIDAKHRR